MKVPFGITPDGRRYLTEEQLVADPYLARFVKMFRRNFRHDPDHQIFILMKPKPTKE